MNSILSITSIDGRYRSITHDLEKYFSEYGLFKYRVKIEIEYLIKLCETLNISINNEYLKSIINNFICLLFVLFILFMNKYYL